MSRKSAVLAQTIANVLMVEERCMKNSLGVVYDVMETLGHEEDDIASAVGFLESIPTHSTGMIYRQDESITFPGKGMGKILTPEARNILSLMEQYSVLDSHTIVDILDRIEVSSFEKGDALNLEELKSIINGVIIDNITLGVEDMVRMASESWGAALH